MNATSPDELAAMRLAISLSAFGLGTTSPNPPVGCVILNAASRIVGQGYHRRKGEAHAEVNALADAGDDAQGGTAVVTLEPCNHFGVTPPCHQALINAGVQRVLIATIDPTSRGEGGAARLRQAGLDLETGVLEAEARLVLGPWLDALTTRRPHITWPSVISDVGSSSRLGDIPDAADLRRVADVVLSADGSVAEAVPGSHLPGVLDLENFSADLSPTETAHALYQAGIRTVLLDAEPLDAARFLEAGLVHRTLTYVPKAETRSESRLADAFFRASFHLKALRQIDGYLCVERRSLHS